MALPRRGGWAAALSLAAIAWTVALAASVFVVPSNDDGSTLAQVNSAWVVVPVAVPALLALFAFTGLHRRCTRASRDGTVLGVDRDPPALRVRRRVAVQHRPLRGDPGASARGLRVPDARRGPRPTQAWKSRRRSGKHAAHSTRANRRSTCR
jgi:hypothetical protein